jgi:UDP-3-O-[3-hydroxymyristoyl] glucosamine N-acyltransferase
MLMPNRKSQATLAQLADLTGAAPAAGTLSSPKTAAGPGATLIHGVAGIRHAREGEIALLAAPRYEKFLPTTAASALVVGPDFDAAATDLPLLIADKPEQAFETIAEHFCPESPRPERGVDPAAVVAPEATVHPSATVGACCVVEPGATIGPGTVLRPLVFVGRDASIGADCFLHPHVTVLGRCTLGDRVVLHAGVVIGSDGFGYHFVAHDGSAGGQEPGGAPGGRGAGAASRGPAAVEGVHQKIAQRGIVEIGDDVEIGANTTIDRARYGRTVIGSGTKIDNLVQVAHNVAVGEHCLLVAQAGIAGSTTLGHHVVIAAQAGLRDHIELGDGAVVAAQSGVPRDIEPGETVFGSPAQDIRKERRCIVHHQRLPELAGQVRELAKTVEELTEKVQRLEAAGGRAKSLEP